jgi:hypothetical protein
MSLKHKQLPTVYTYAVIISSLTSLVSQMSNSPGNRVLPPIIGIFDTKRAAISSVTDSPSTSTKTMEYSNNTQKV